MKILKIEIENYKKLRIFEKCLDGDNLHVAGATGTGKTTAISALWSIIEKCAEPLTKGETKGKVKITLGDENKKVFAERKFTNKTNQVIILTSSGDKISVKDFKQWYADLGENPHLIMDMKPKEQVETLLKSVQLPDGIDLQEMDKVVADLSLVRTDWFREKDKLKKKLGEKPEKVKRVELQELLEQKDQAIQHNNKYDRGKEQIKQFQSDIERWKEEIARLEEQIEKHIPEIEKREKWLKKNNKIDTEKIDTLIRKAQTINQQAEEYERWVDMKKEYTRAEKEWEKTEREIQRIREEKKKIIAEAKFPLPDIDIRDNEIYFRDIPLQNCGRSEQLLVCGALAAENIARAELKVVRMDGMESMSIKDFEMLEEVFNKKGIQVLASRVTRGEIEENEIVIEEGVYEENNK